MPEMRPEIEALRKKAVGGESAPSSSLNSRHASWLVSEHLGRCCSVRPCARDSAGMAANVIEDYRAAFGPLVSRGRSLAEGLNAGLGLPHGTVVFDDSELRAAHAWAGRDR